MRLLLSSLLLLALAVTATHQLVVYQRLRLVEMASQAQTAGHFPLAQAYLQLASAHELAQLYRLQSQRRAWMFSVDGPPTRLHPHILRASEASGVDPRLIAAVMMQGSAYQPGESSMLGRRGLMQMTPEESQRMGVRDPADEGQDILGGARLLREHLDRYGGSVPLALAGYIVGDTDKYGTLTLEGAQCFSAHVLRSYFYFCRYDQ